jgi:hypothetical protein
VEAARRLDEMNRRSPLWGEQALEHAEKFVAHVLRLAEVAHSVDSVPLRPAFARNQEKRWQ